MGWYGDECAAESALVKKKLEDAYEEALAALGLASAAQTLASANLASAQATASAAAQAAAAADAAFLAGTGTAEASAAAATASNAAAQAVGTATSAAQGMSSAVILAAKLVAAALAALVGFLAGQGIGYGLDHVTGGAISDFWDWVLGTEKDEDSENEDSGDEGEDKNKKVGILREKIIDGAAAKAIKSVYNHSSKFEFDVPPFEMILKEFWKPGAAQDAFLLMRSNIRTLLHVSKAHFDRKHVGPALSACFEDQARCYRKFARSVEQIDVLARIEVSTSEFDSFVADIRRFGSEALPKAELSVIRDILSPAKMKLTPEAGEDIARWILRADARLKESAAQETVAVQESRGVSAFLRTRAFDWDRLASRQWGAILNAKEIRPREKTARRAKKAA